LIVYADSSFLVSLYVLDSHSPDALQRLGSSPRLLVTPFHRAELANAFYQCVFRSTLSEFEAARAWRRFEGDLQGGIFETARFPDSAWDLSITLAHRYCASLGVRTLDTVHVAAALELGADRFWTFDERQARLAEAAGLDTGAA
jgi:predicted nucleic acid-binding protein